MLNNVHKLMIQSNYNKRLWKLNVNYWINYTTAYYILYHQTKTKY